MTQTELDLREEMLRLGFTLKVTVDEYGINAQYSLSDQVCALVHRGRNESLDYCVASAAISALGTFVTSEARKRYEVAQR